MVETNRCQRLTYRMIADNRERNLTVCQAIIDGRWSDWSDLGECKGTQKIEDVGGFRCGEGISKV